MLPVGQRAWPRASFRRYSRVRRNPSQQPCSSWMIVSLGLCLLACAITSAAGEWQSGDGYRFKTLTVSTNSQAGFTSSEFNRQTGSPGSIEGRGENTQAIGATIRLEQNGGLGPKREIRLGSGYWSQDSLVQLFVVEDSKAKFHIRWADFSISIVPIPAG